LPEFHKINTFPSVEKQYLSKLHAGLTSTADGTRTGFLGVSPEDLFVQDKTLLRRLLLPFALTMASLVMLGLSAENLLWEAAGGPNRGALDEGVRGATDSIERLAEGSLAGE
jgi:hypothetical protein